MASGLRFRTYVNRRIAFDEVVPDDKGERLEVVARKQSAIINHATEVGHRWYCEVYDPDYGGSVCWGTEDEAPFYILQQEHTPVEMIEALIDARLRNQMAEQTSKRQERP